MIGIVIVFGVVLFSMILHELAHGVVAYFLGDDTAKMEGRLTLNPVKHIDPVLSILVPVLLYIAGGPIFGGAKPVPVDSRNLKHGVWGMALVAIAGPLTNFVLAFLAVLIGKWTGLLMLDDGAMMYMKGFWGELMVNLVYVNLGFGIFNLIPIPPLDGSRVLYALMPDGVREVMNGMEQWGIMIVMVLVVVFSSVLSTFMTGAMQGILDFFSLVTG